MSTADRSPGRWTRRLFLILLHAYPRGFRRRHGDAMLATLTEAWRSRRGGAAGRAAFWARTVWDLVSEGIAERLRPGPLVHGAGDPLGSPRREGAVGTLRTDLHRAARALVRDPGFTLLVTVTLALGIGANVAILSLVDAVVLRPLPVKAPDRLVRVYEALNDHSPRGRMSYVVYREVAEDARAITGMAAHCSQESELRRGERAVSVDVGLVSGNYFDVLGVPATLGRTLVPDDEAGWGARAVAVLSWDLWQREFGGDPAVVGRSIHFGPAGSADFTVVGVAPRGFRGASLTWETDAWVPATTGGLVSGEAGFFAVPEVLTEPLAAVFEVYARVPEGIGPEVAEAELNRARRSSGAPSAEGVAEPMSLVPIREAAAPASRPELIRFLALLVGVVALTFLVACVNVANLLLVRARRRQRDLAVRAALGAGRGRLFRELGLESLLLGGLACAAALLTAQGTVALLSDFTLPGGVAVARVDVRLGAGALAFTGALGLLAALLFGTVPAWRASGSGALSMLRARSGGGWRRSGWGILLAVQTGLSVILLVGAALFGRTLQEALRTDLGFDPEGIAAATVRLRSHGVSMAEAPTKIDGMIAATQRHPSVAAAAFATHVPVGGHHMRLPFVPEENEDATLAVAINIVSPEYFHVLGVPVLAGRAFDERDTPNSAPVIVVNRAAARQIWGTDDPVGRLGQLAFGGRAPATIVGVVGQTLTYDLATPDEPFVYYPLSQLAGPAMDHGSIIARAAPGKPAPVEAVRGAIREADPLLPFEDVRRVDRQIDQVMASQRFGAALLGLFSGLALLIAAIGIYGVAAWTVAAQRREIGIRMALGARTPSVLSSVLGRAAGATAAGGGVGVLASAGLARLVRAFLYRVTPLDPGAFGAALFALAVAAALATWIPARRAVRVDPAETMRTE